MDFVESDVHHALDLLQPASFDLVYTGVGALCWWPDPVDEAHTDRIVIDYPYFERTDPVVGDDAGTYVETDADFSHNLWHSWNHGLGEIITALLDSGLEVTGLVEHDSVPWSALPGQMTKDDAGEWRLTDRPWRLAASYTLQARRR